MIADAVKRRCPIEGEIQAGLDQGVEMIGPRRVGLNALHPGNGDIILPSRSIAVIEPGAPRLIMDDEVADRPLDLAQIGAREMIAYLRQVVVDRRRLVGEDRLGHRDLALRCRSTLTSVWPMVTLPESDPTHAPANADRHVPRRPATPGKFRPEIRKGRGKKVGEAAPPRAPRLLAAVVALAGLGIFVELRRNFRGKGPVVATVTRPGHPNP